MSSEAPIRLRHRSCPVCGAQDAKLVVSSDPSAESLDWRELSASWRGLFKNKPFFKYDRCVQCGLLYSRSYFSDDQLAALYGEMEENMREVGSDLLERTQRGYFDAVFAYLNAGRRGGYFELGPDVGYFAAHCAATGKFDDYWMLEPNRAVWPQLSSVGSHTGRVKLLSELSQLDEVADGSITFGAAVHVLDHIVDPVAVLGKIRTKLTPDACFMSVTHDERSLLARLLGKRWPAFCLQHPQLYNARSIRALFGAAGFDLVFVRKSVNYFPLGFLLRQGLFAAMGHDVQFLRLLDGISVGLKLGNIIALARPAVGAE